MTSCVERDLSLSLSPSSLLHPYFIYLKYMYIINPTTTKMNKIMSISRATFFLYDLVYFFATFNSFTPSSTCASALREVSIIERKSKGNREEIERKSRGNLEEIEMKSSLNQEEIERKSRGNRKGN
jgi:hypothetical protein